MLKTLLLVIFISLTLGCSSTTETLPPEGWVELKFDIDENGDPVNIIVVDSDSGDTFDKEAIRALSKWKYKPKVVDGKAVAQRGLKVRLDFKAENES
jgi:TonB family protein